jgi:hypothetical protein
VEDGWVDDGVGGAREEEVGEEGESRPYGVGHGNVDVFEFFEFFGHGGYPIEKEVFECGGLEAVVVLDGFLVVPGEEFEVFDLEVEGEGEKGEKEFGVIGY